MKVVIAPCCFKGNLTAREVANAIRSGILRVLPDAEIIIKPMADGGDGTAQALADATGGRMVTETVTGPLGEPVKAQWGVLGDGVTAVIEMASASGLALIPHNRLNPYEATTFGTGELILAALDRGCCRLLIGVGGSGTNDGGAGMAQALGVRFLDSAGNELPFGGAALAKLARINASGLDRRLAECEVLIACDVNNPLCGANGASAVYGPQKGATPQMVGFLDKSLHHLADIVQEELRADFRNAPGAGAGGGLGMMLMTLVKNARVSPGSGMVIEMLGLADDLKGADIVFTAEGKIDFQTVNGKAPAAVAQAAKEAGIPVIAIAGQIGDGYQSVYEQGITSIECIAPGPISLEESLAQAEKLTADAAERAFRLFLSKKT